MSARRPDSAGAGRPSIRYGLSAIVPAFAAALTWFCCLPIAAGTLGVVVAASGSALTPLRPYFAGAAVALLALGFYQAFRSRPAKASCVPGTTCALHTSRLGQRPALLFLAGAVAALLTIERWSSHVILWFL